MKITSVKIQQKNSERVSISVDGKYAFSLSVNEVLEHKIKTGNTLDQTALETLKKLSQDGKVRLTSFEWLMNRPHSSKEYIDYLRKRKVDEELTGRLVAEFTQKKLLDDARFTEWSLQRLVHKNKSQRAIVQELKQKGIDVVTIQSKVSSEGVSDRQALDAVIAKVSSRTRYKDQQKLIAYLLSKGFTYGDIKQALAVIEPEQEP